MNCSSRNGVNLTDDQFKSCDNQAMEEIALKYLQKKSEVPTVYEVAFNNEVKQRVTEVEIIPKVQMEKGVVESFVLTNGHAN